MVPVVPALAALFDRMTTHVVDDRFTAEEAYQFFQVTTAYIPDDARKTPVSLVLNFDGMVDAGVYWSKLSASDQMVWGRHRTPPRPWWMRMLGRIMRYDFGFEFVSFVRRILRI